MDTLLTLIACLTFLGSVLVGLMANGSWLGWILSAILGLTVTTAIAGIGIIGAIERGGKPKEKRADPNDGPDVRGL
jgi:multisubunit Na+/H+ antiporter MnhG subunit